MLSVKIYGPNQVKLEENPAKEPAEDEVLIKIMATGLCGTDYELYSGEMAYLKSGQSKLPITPGHEWSGIIEKVGDQINEFEVGEKVSGECTINCGHCRYCASGDLSQCINRSETGVMKRDGSFAEYITFPASHLHKVSGISFEEAALIEPTCVAMNAVMRGHINPFDNVMVCGPGPVGLQAAQIAKKIFGAKRVILVGTRDERLETAKRFNLDGYINIRTENIEKRIREITNGEMINVVLEESGGAGVFDDIKKVINPLGRIVLNGFFGNKQANIDWDFITTNEISIGGSLSSPKIWDDVIHLIETGKLETKYLITHYLKLQDFEKGLDIMINRKENVCKIIFQP